MKGEMLKRLIMICLVGFYLVGCGRVFKQDTWFNFIDDQPSDLVFFHRKDKSGKDIDLNNRDKYINWINKSYAEFQNGYDWTMDELNKQAVGSSLVRIGTTGSGIAAGIAATALVVASPANAVWVAGLGGFSTGILGIQSVVTREGYSKVAFARVLKKYKEKLDKLLVEYNKSYTELLKAKDEQDNDKKWVTAQANVENTLRSLYFEVFNPPLSEYREGDLNEEERKAIEKRIIEIENKLNQKPS